MSMYATVADFGRYGLNAAGTEGIPDADIEACIADASAMVDGVLRGRGYTLPLVAWGNDLRSLVCKLAAYEVVFHLRGANPADPAHAAIVTSWQWARDQLRDIAKNVVSLDVTTTDPERVASVLPEVYCNAEPDGSTTRGW